MMVMVEHPARATARRLGTLLFAAIVAVPGWAETARPDDSAMGALAAFPPSVFRLALYRIAGEHPDPRVARALARVRERAPRLVEDPRLFRAARLALATGRTGEDLPEARGETGREARALLRKSLPEDVMTDRGLAAAFRHLAGAPDLEARLVREAREVLGLEAARDDERTRNACLSAQAAWAPGGELPTCPRDGSPLAPGADGRPGCVHHRAPTGPTVPGAPVLEEELEERNAFAWARAQLSARPMAAPIPDPD